MRLDKKSKKFVRKAIAQFHSEMGPSDAHILPTQQQPWHIDKAYCFCAPEIIDEHPLTGYRLYLHRAIIH